ncbi:hypothetical protein ABPG75_012619 [Micractinium tetrahymenae]
MLPPVAAAPAVPLSVGARPAAVQAGGICALVEAAAGTASERQGSGGAAASSPSTAIATAHAQPLAAHSPIFPSHHGGPFSAVAALVAASLQRAERGGATYTHLDVLLPGSQAASRGCGGCSAQEGPAAGSAAAAEAGAGAEAAVQQAQQEPQQQGQQQEREAAAAPQNTAAGPRLLHDQQHPVLLFEDDAAGLSPQQLRRSLGVPHRANAASVMVAAVGGGSPSGVSSRAASCKASQWPDFVHAALRLGSAALVLTKRRGQGASVGLLHASPAPTGGDEAWLEAAVVDFAPDGSRQLAASSTALKPEVPASPAAVQAWRTAAMAAAATAATTAWSTGADTISRRWVGGASEAQLAAQLAAMPEQGTRLLIAGLHTQPTSAGVAGAGEATYELDWSSEPSDLQLAAQPAGNQGSAQMPAADFTRLGQQQQQQQQAPGEPPDPGAQRCMLLHHSLRAYLAVLFLRWPDGWRLRLRGSDVQHQRIRDWMKWPAVEEYRPRGIRDEVDEHGFQMQHVVSIHLGFLWDAPNTAMQGVCIYQQNRLVKPFWRVHSSPTAGRGVVGVLEVDFLGPTPDWQGFERSHVLSKLEAFLKRAIPGYYKRHVHLLTGAPPPMERAAGPLPSGAAWRAAGPLAGGGAAGLGSLGSHPAAAARPGLQPQQHMLLAMQHAQLAAAAAALAGQQGTQMSHAPPALPLGLLGSAAGAAHLQQLPPALVPGLLAALGVAGQAPELPVQGPSATAQHQSGQAFGPATDLGTALLLAAQQTASPVAALAAALQQAQQAQGQQQELLRALLGLLAQQAGTAPAAAAAAAAPPASLQQPQPQVQPQRALATLGPSPFGSAQNPAAEQSPAATLLTQLQLFASAGSAPPVSAPVQTQLLQQLSALAESSDSGRLASTAVDASADMHRLSSSGTQALVQPQPAQQQPQQVATQQQPGGAQAGGQAAGGPRKPAGRRTHEGAELHLSRGSSPKRACQAQA